MHHAIGLVIAKQARDCVDVVNGGARQRHVGRQRLRMPG